MSAPAVLLSSAAVAAVRCELVEIHVAAIALR
jgi:hypothetical protein